MPDFRTGKDWISFCKQRNRNGLPYKKTSKLNVFHHYIFCCGSVYAI